MPVFAVVNSGDPAALMLGGILGFIIALIAIYLMTRGRDNENKNN